MEVEGSIVLVEDSQLDWLPRYLTQGCARAWIYVKSSCSELWYERIIVCQRNLLEIHHERFPVTYAMLPKLYESSWSSQMPARQRQSLSSLLTEDSDEGSDTNLSHLHSDFTLSGFAWPLDPGYWRIYWYHKTTCYRPVLSSLQVDNC